ncbi:MAG: 4Fe-4S binding protein [Rhodobacterales bacterium]
MSKKLLICDCLGSQRVDPDAITSATGVVCSRIHSSLCMDQINLAAKAMSDGDVMIACQQESQRFTQLAEELDLPVPDFVDLRDRSGWSDQGAKSGPKMAALVAEAMLDNPLPKSVDVVSEGTCLIIGSTEVAIQAANDLAGALVLTVLLGPDQDVERSANFDTVRGTLKHATGTLGRFSVKIDALQQIIPGGRGAPKMTAPQDGAISECDIILDLTGGTPLFAAPEKRDGYLRADPRSQRETAAAILSASQMVGTFEKLLYVRMEPSLCAHSRAEKPACSKCLNICPTGAITPAGEHVTVDPMICAGCGACAAVCPSGAISFDAPTVDVIFRRVQTLAATFRKAGGKKPRLLVHDADYGSELISLAARFSRGLPADVIPLEVEALAGFGHAEILAALSSGFVSVDILLAPRTERDALVTEVALAVAISGNPAVEMLDFDDPDALSDHLFATKTGDAIGNPVLPMGTRRQVARLAAKALRPGETLIELPPGAPYGAVLVDKDACTLCLSCVSLCPSGALADNPDLPQLRFQEDACLQCGLCVNICPEKAISLLPQLDLSDGAFSQKVLHEEEPFACVECGSLFGVKSTIEKITEKLAGKHAMFASPAAARMIQMCDNCRINAQFHSTNNPLAGGERPRVRTTDDYFSKRKDH